MADNNKDASTPSASEPAVKTEDHTPTDPVEAAKDNLQKQKISGILRAVLEVPPVENGDDKKLRYPWFVDVALGLGLLLAVGGFSLGLFKMYVTHKAQQCLIQGNYQAAIGLLKGSPVPGFGMTLHDEDPDQMLARALFMDARLKIEKNDIRGGLAELQQIRAGTDEFDEAQRILAENFTPSDTQLTGGVVQNELTTGGSK